jgi:hypothetical protein
MNVLDAINDNKIFGQHFRGDSWQSWRVFLSALFGLPLNAEQLKLYQQCTGRTVAPRMPASECWVCCGRRAGKSFALATIAIFLSCFRDWRPHLGPGEKATVMIVCVDRRQARTVMRFCKGLLKAVPMLARTVEAERVEGIDLRGNVTLEVHTASFRAVRGYAICAALLDELAFWYGADPESSDPDVEIINAIRPAMAQFPNAVMLCASSPYARRGALWDAYRKHFAKDNDPVLVWQAPTRVMNPLVPQSTIDAAMEADPASASSEYGAQFRTDLEQLLTREAVSACISLGVHERAPVAGIRYSGFVDPAGGSGGDSMALAIAHEQDGAVIIDALCERKPPFSPEGAVLEFVDTLKSYNRVTKVVGDRYGGDWPREQFAKHGVRYEPSSKPKSDLYRDLLPATNSRKVDLLDNAKLHAQLCSLERRTARGGRDSIDHPPGTGPGAHDDLSNCVAGVVAELAIRGSGFDSSYNWVGGPDPNDPAPTWAEQRSLWQHPSGSNLTLGALV